MERWLALEDLQEPVAVPELITPRRFQQIKVNCVRVQEEIDAKLQVLKKSRRAEREGSTGPAPRSPKRRPRTPTQGSLKDRLRLKIARSRSMPTFSTPSEPPKDSVALELERELGKGPLKAQDISRFCQSREQRRSRPQSATNFVQRNVESPAHAQHAQRAQLELQHLRRCARTDLARKRRAAVLAEMHRAQQADYRTRLFRREKAKAATLERQVVDEETVEVESRVAVALANLAKFMPSKVMKLFTRLFDQEQLFQIFTGGVAEHMAMACRLYALVRRLIMWSRIWKRHKAAEVLQRFMRIPPPLGYRVKLPVQRYVYRLRQLQRTWRHFAWRLKSMTRHVYESMWRSTENEFLEDLFTFCPSGTVVQRPEFLGEEAERKTSRSEMKPKTSKRASVAAAGTEDMMKQMLLEAFVQKKRSCQFKPQVAKLIIMRALLERLYLHAQRLPVGAGRLIVQQLRGARGMTFGFPRAVVLDEKGVDVLIWSSHRAVGVRPVLRDRAEALLPCPVWRVRAARRLLEGKRSIREALLDVRTEGQAAEGSPEPELEVAQGSAQDLAPDSGEAASPDVSSLTGAMLALKLLRRERRSETGGESVASGSSASSKRPEDVVDAALVYDREALVFGTDEDLPQPPSTHAATIEAGWPSVFRLWSLQEMLED